MDYSDLINNDKKINDESEQKKIESEINEVLRNIDLSYEIVEPEINKIILNNIEVNDVEYILPESDDFSEFNDSENEISFDLFSSHTNVEQEII